MLTNMDRQPVATDQITASQDDDGRYIWLPFSVLLGIIVLSALVYLMARKNRKIKHFYCKRRLTPRNYIDDEDSDVSIARGDEYGEDSVTECLLKGKLQINSRHTSYQATQVTPSEALNTTPNGNGALQT